MKVTKKKIDDLNYKLTLDIAGEDYAEIERKKLAERRKTAEFKGFRKGNVPASLIKKIYGEQALVESVNTVISEQLDKYISENKLHILGEPLASETQPEVEWVSGGDFKFVFDIALSPEVNVEAGKDDEVAKYTITTSEKEKTEMKENLAKYYEEKKEEKTDDELVKEVAERLSANYKQEAEWRLTRDIRDYFVKKAGVTLPEEFLKRWLFAANNGKVSKEDIEKEFPGFAEDFKWQLVRGSFMKKYDFKVTEADIREAAKAFVTYQYAMYGIANVPEDMIEEASKRVFEDRQQLARLEEQCEDQKVLEKLKEEITIKSKRISSEKFREL